MENLSSGAPCLLLFRVFFSAPLTLLFLRPNVRHCALLVVWPAVRLPCRSNASRPAPRKQGRLESSDASIDTAEGAERAGKPGH